jgi:hypothetical protein
MAQASTIEERFERLGASPQVATRLSQKGFDPFIVIGIDHPDPEVFVAGEEIDDDVDIDELIEEHYPCFESSVLERLTQCPWPLSLWITEVYSFPGPVNRVCTLGESGINHKVFDLLPWFDEDGISIMDQLDSELPEPELIQPIRVKLDDVEIILTVDGAELNQAAEAEWAFACLGGRDNRAIELLSLWNAVTRPVWPVNPLQLRFWDYGDLLDEGPQGLDRLVPMLKTLMLQRLRAVAPLLPDYWTAFAEEHPTWAP